MTKNKKLAWTAGLIAAAFILSLYFDNYIIRGISYLKNSFLDESLSWLTSTSFEIIIFFLLTILLLWNKNKRKWVLPLWFTLFLSAVASFILKVAIQRPRPFQQGLIELSSFLIKNSYYTWDFAFPSSHTMLAFCVLPIVSREFPKLRYVWALFACLIAFSRVYFGFHFLSDVIAGAVIGYLIGALILNVEKENHVWENLYWKVYNKFVK
ncbi:MAG: phosphatase PAP2 family protein [Nanoarchaeota archaeon]